MRRSIFYKLNGREFEVFYEVMPADPDDAIMSSYADDFSFIDLETKVDAWDSLSAKDQVRIIEACDDAIEDDEHEDCGCGDL